MEEQDAPAAVQEKDTQEAQPAADDVVQTESNLAETAAEDNQLEQKTTEGVSSAVIQPEPKLGTEDCEEKESETSQLQVKAPEVDEVQYQPPSRGSTPVPEPGPAESEPINDTNAVLVNDDQAQLDTVRDAIAASGIILDLGQESEIVGTTCEDGNLATALAALPELVGPEFRATPPATQRARGPYILLHRLPRRDKASYITSSTVSRSSSSRPQRKRSRLQNYRAMSGGSSRSTDDRYAGIVADGAYEGNSLDEDEDEGEDELGTEDDDYEAPRRKREGIAQSRNRRPGATIKCTRERAIGSASSAGSAGRDRSRAIEIHSSESQSSSEDELAGPRVRRNGSGRPRKRRVVESESEFEGRSEESDDSARSSRRATSLIEEPWSRRHREHCDRCDRLPADEILAKALERAKKRGGRPLKRRKVDDDAIPDEELAEILGGWVECERCTSAAHWNCIGVAQRKQFLDEAVPGTKGVGVDEMTTTVCARCAVNPACFVCKAEHSKPVIEEPTKGDAANGVEGKEGAVAEAANEKDATTTTDAASKDNTGSVDVAADQQQTPQGPSSMDKDSSSGPQPIVIDETIADDSAQNTAGATTRQVSAKPDSDIEVQVANDSSHHEGSNSAEVAETLSTEQKADAPTSIEPLLFRCKRCKRSAHYHHMRNPFDYEATDDQLAEHYQEGTRPWECHQCRDWVWSVDKIIAWRPDSVDAAEPKRQPDEVPRWKDPLPREYLVKFQDRGFRHVTWVPHLWLVAANAGKLRNFLEQGPSLDLITNETLAAKGDDMETPSIAAILDEEDRARGRAGVIPNTSLHKSPLADPDAVDSIPIAWKTADRVLDVFLQPPSANQLALIKRRKKGKKSKVSRSNVIESDSEEEDTSGFDLDESLPTIVDGMPPDEADMAEVATWEAMLDVNVTEDDADKLVKRVTWCFIKWDDLQYDQSCWDTPPPHDSPLWPAFAAAFKAYLRARTITIPVLSSTLAKKRDAEAATIFKPFKEQPKCIVGGQLMPFQLEGLQWLVYKHSLRQSCILADDMGLGKTIQIAALLGYLGSAQFSIYPSLVIVPNSTITNWVREFEKWVPHMRVVPFFGEAASRKVILKYELYHKGSQGKASELKAHVVLTTYDMITGSDFKIIKSIPRWEMLIIDEGQRLKSDSSKIFRQLKTLNSVHRILLTGTPLNNNLRELFNLLNFLDEANFRDLSDLEERFADLDDANVQELHTMIKPYILRRVKADVLKLPPKSEIIVPISLRPLQKQLYKGVLEKNADLLEAILAGKRSLGKKKAP